jgi:hypothetical protein
MARSQQELASDLAPARETKVLRTRLAVRRTPPAKVRPESPGPTTTTLHFAISTDPTVDERDGAREFETVFETEQY